MRTKSDVQLTYEWVPYVNLELVVAQTALGAVAGYRWRLPEDGDREAVQALLATEAMANLRAGQKVVLPPQAKRAIRWMLANRILADRGNSGDARWLARIVLEEAL